jgi:hypothetical protein
MKTIRYVNKPCSNIWYDQSKEQMKTIRCVKNHAQIYGTTRERRRCKPSAMVLVVFYTPDVTGLQGGDKEINDPCIRKSAHPVLKSKQM